MATEKLSATVDEEVLAAVRARVGARGLSSFVNRALRHELQRASLERRSFIPELVRSVDEESL